MAIRRLCEGTVNRIAAGEVVERPAAAVKELVENALDAGASRIDIATSNGGADLILVEDDGSGMEADELRLAIERHATSKLLERDGEDDLSHIETLGFRGEALPSIGAVARLSIASRSRDGRGASDRCRRRHRQRSPSHRVSCARPARHPGGRARAVLCHPGAAEISQKCPFGRPRHLGHRQAAGHGAARCRLHADRRWPSRAGSGSGARSAGKPADAAGANHGARFS